MAPVGPSALVRIAGSQPDTAAILAARQALATANGIVDQDRRNHSTDCVAVDQKLVDKASLQLVQATSRAQQGSVLNLIA